ncbi:MAG TPA: hypothetical protein PKC37_04330 [Kaistella sp.]|jgi:hypothetical protein|nr:hypothetical protein [Flavobacteriales bacterium]HMU07112.1 hypothetical protein [Kaistella sp.]HOB24174.1 hypothetical protein [Kaistella sp.]HQD44749.1 hypothetical protein [Kaistella sp.]
MKTLSTFLFVIFAMIFSAQTPMEKMLKSIAKESQAQKNIKNTPTEFLPGFVTITMEETKYYYPAKKGIRRGLQTRLAVSTGIYGRVSQGKVKMLMSKQDNRLLCKAEDHCPVYNGGSKFVISRNENATIKESKDYTLQVSRSTLEQDFRWIKDKEKYVVVSKSKVAGENKIEGITLEIKPFMPANFNGNQALPSLNPPYVLWLEGGRDMTNLLEEPYEEGENFIWNDAKEKLVPADPKLSLQIPYDFNTPERPERDGDTYYQQMLITDVKGLDNFLLNPKGSWSSSFSVVRYYKDDMAETKIRMNVTVSLFGNPELVPLEPIPLPELPSLEPLKDDEEIQLTPLEPMKD